MSVGGFFYCGLFLSVRFEPFGSLAPGIYSSMEEQGMGELLLRGTPVIMSPDPF